MKNVREHNKESKSVQLRHESYYVGPLPRPEDLEKYNKVVPGSAERIISMAEKEMDHRHIEETKISKAMIMTTYLSIIFAFISVILLCGIVVYTIYLGHVAAGVSIAVGSIATVAGVFLTKSIKSKNKNSTSQIG